MGERSWIIWYRWWGLLSISSSLVIPIGWVIREMLSIDYYYYKPVGDGRHDTTHFWQKRRVEVVSLTQSLGSAGTLNTGSTEVISETIITILMKLGAESAHRVSIGLELIILSSRMNNYGIRIISSGMVSPVRLTLQRDHSFMSLIRDYFISKM